MPKFSVIIPTYNRLPLLKVTLESVWRQSFTDYEVIVVDDGSADGTSGWLAEVASKVKPIKQVNSGPGTVRNGAPDAVRNAGAVRNSGSGAAHNSGPGAARNRGAEKACGEYLAFLDSDDLWFPWTLGTFDAVVTSHAPAFLCASFRQFERPSELAGVHGGPLVAEAFRNY